MDALFEKKIFILLDSIDKIKNMEINKITATMMLCKKVALAFTPPFLVLLTTVVVTLLSGYVSLNSNGSPGAVEILSLITKYSLLLVFLAVLIILVIIYISIKFVKYKLIK
ncbi:hypothetical protein MKS88_000786 [Plasmodium brasilianum]|uniref:Uncharacterized protein n=1 Tax=Plasmodium brasilianum TaxID=5824 RepID=A0ACB9YET4_PLABR|nr:hypothetical protein MKS88_000786 [Plasmodium brasilianum]